MNPSTSSSVALLPTAIMPTTVRFVRSSLGGVVVHERQITLSPVSQPADDQETSVPAQSMPPARNLNTAVSLPMNRLPAASLPAESHHLAAISSQGPHCLSPGAPISQDVVRHPSPLNIGLSQSAPSQKALGKRKALPSSSSSPAEGSSAQSTSQPTQKKRKVGPSATNSAASTAAPSLGAIENGQPDRRENEFVQQLLPHKQKQELWLDQLSPPITPGRRGVLDFERLQHPGGPTHPGFNYSSPKWKEVLYQILARRPRATLAELFFLGTQWVPELNKPLSQDQLQKMRWHEYIQTMKTHLVEPWFEGDGKGTWWLKHADGPAATSTLPDSGEVSSVPAQKSSSRKPVSTSLAPPPSDDAAIAGPSSTPASKPQRLVLKFKKPNAASSAPASNTPPTVAGPPSTPASKQQRVKLTFNKPASASSALAPDTAPAVAGPSSTPASVSTPVGANNEILPAELPIQPLLAHYDSVVFSKLQAGLSPHLASEQALSRPRKKSLPTHQDPASLVSRPNKYGAGIPLADVQPADLQPTAPAKHGYGISPFGQPPAYFQRSQPRNTHHMPTTVFSETQLSASTREDFSTRARVLPGQSDPNPPRPEWLETQREYFATEGGRGTLQKREKRLATRLGVSEMPSLRA